MGHPPNTPPLKITYLRGLLLARPGRTIHVPSFLSSAELPDEITEVTALSFWCRI